MVIGPRGEELDGCENGTKGGGWPVGNKEENESDREWLGSIQDSCTLGRFASDPNLLLLLSHRF